MKLPTAKSRTFTDAEIRALKAAHSALGRDAITHSDGWIERDPESRRTIKAMIEEAEKGSR
jgi:hypothetical protein